jgi:DNA polymerase-4
MLLHLYIDLNAFFASCEQQRDPALRGRPVAVVPVFADTTSVIAASYQAKKFGVRTLTNVGEAKRLCPGLVLVQAGTANYLDYHDRVLRAIDLVIPVHRVCSVDEFDCLLDPTQRTPDAARDLARRIKHAIRTHVGECITCSIGVAPNRLLAKVAGDMHKPDGFTVLEQADIPTRLLPLTPRDLPGVGPKMELRLAAAGIRTMADLYARSEGELAAAWGSIVGRRWYHLIRGEDLDLPESPVRSIGHEHVLGPEQRTGVGARAVLVRLIHKAASRARDKGYLAGEITVSARLNKWNPHDPHQKWDCTHKLEPPANDTLRLVAATTQAWDARPDFVRRSKLFKVAVRLTALEPLGATTGFLFGQPERDQRLGAAMDAVNRKFGRDTIRGGSMLPGSSLGAHTPPAFVVPQRFRAGPAPSPDDNAADARGSRRGRVPDGLELDEPLDEPW